MGTAIGIGIGIGFEGIAGGGSNFSPASISNLDLWVEATFGLFSEDTGTTPSTDGGVVAFWRDRSSNGNNLIQTTDGHRPLYRATGGNGGRPCIEFVSADRLMATTNITGTVKTIFWVGSKAAAGAGYDTCVRLDQVQMLYRTNSVDQWGAFAGADVVSGVTIDTDFGIYAMIQRAANDIDLVTDGVINNETTGTSFPTSAGASAFGSSTDGTQDIVGKASHIIVYNKALSTAELSQVVRYLSAQTGIAVS